ncbi:MAG TPA: hypothetical protein VGO80_06635 [Solirubrobacteraceae bacterium]|jgi:hypothetical protein|nr:hypothetical protein [Solirubrobacteraceae bacterium]
MLLLNTAAHPTLLRYRHAQLGRLCVPGCNSQLAETLATMKVGFDNGCYHGLDPVAVCRMYEQIAGWPPMGARLAKAYPWASTTSTVTYLADGGFREELVLGGPLPDIHPNLLWCTVPDVVRCACGLPTHCRVAARGPQCAPRGDSAATLERFAEWHPFLVHLPLAFVLQDGAERPGMVPWDAAGVTAMFVGGSDRWRYGAACADLVREARRRGLLVHFGRISSLSKIRYIHSIGATSFDSSRYSRWRDITLGGGLAAASQPAQLRMVD